MKKIALILVAGAFTLASCKKDYTCTCTVRDGDGSVVSSSTTTITDHRSDAKAKCDEDDGSVGSYTQDCEI